MKTITIPEAALRQHVAVFGRTGSGKTYAAKSAIVEPLLRAKKRVCIMDPTGAWHGLKSSADGKRPAFEVVIFGGEHADVRITDSMGSAVAELIATSNIPCIIDLSDFGVGERNRFAAAFAETLLRRNREPINLVIDEADEFMPLGAAGSKDVGLSTMLNRFDRIVRRGRRLGFRVTMISQRPAVLHTNARSSAAAVVLMRLSSPQDRKAVEEWIKGQADSEAGKKVLESLATLDRGEGWLWFPEGGILERGMFPKIQTFDSSATPDHDGAIPEPVRIAEVDLSSIRAALEVASAEADANDPKKLRARIAELERAAPAPVDGEAFRKAGWEQGYREGYLEASNIIEPVVSDAFASMAAVEDACRQFYSIRAAAGRNIRLARERLPAKMAAAQQAPSAHPVPVVRQAATRVVRGTEPPPDGIQPRHLRILAAIAWFERVAGIEGPTRAQVAARAGVSSTSSSYANDLSAMKSAGLIGYPGTGNLCRTDAGRRIAVEEPTGDVWEDLSKVVDPRHIRILRALQRGSKTRESLAEATGASPTSSSFANDLSKLKTLALVEYPGKGEVAIAGWLR